MPAQSARFWKRPASDWSGPSRNGSSQSTITYFARSGVSSLSASASLVAVRKRAACSAPPCVGLLIGTRLAVWMIQ